MLNLKPPRHTPTLPISAALRAAGRGERAGQGARAAYAQYARASMNAWLMYAGRSRRARRLDVAGRHRQALRREGLGCEATRMGVFAWRLERPPRAGRHIIYLIVTFCT